MRSRQAGRTDWLRSGYSEPLNLGTDRMVSVNQLVDIVAGAAKKSINKRHDLSKPQGVRGRNSDNTRLGEYLEWTPRIELEDGLEVTYRWIESQVLAAKEPVGGD